MNMARIEFDDTFHLADTMINLRDEIESEGKYPLVVTCAKYEVAKALLESLIMCGEPISIGVDLEDCEWSGYDKEFIVSLTEEGVSVEKAWHETNQWHEVGYLDCEGDIAFVHDECSSRIINHINSDKAYEFSIIDVEDEDYYDDECDCCDCDECRKIADSEVDTNTNSVYMINGKAVSKKLYEETFAEFDKNFKSRMKEFEDEMDNFRRLMFQW